MGPCRPVVWVDARKFICLEAEKPLNYADKVAEVIWKTIL
jgi:hypothetical protein